MPTIADRLNGACVAPLGRDEADEHTAFLLRQPNTLLYASHRYRVFLEHLLGCGAEYYVVRENGSITGLLPLMVAKGALGRVYNSLPFYGSHGGVIATTPTAEALLLEKYNELIAQDGVAAANLVANPLMPSNYGQIAQDTMDSRIGQFTPLNGDGDAAAALMQSFHYKTRNMIRKAEKSGLTITIDNSLIDFLQETHVENMAAIGGLAKSCKYFELIDQDFRRDEDYRIYAAWHDGRPVAAALLFYFNRTVEYFTPVIKEAYRSLQPLSLIIFRAMIDAAQQGYKCWNWGGTWSSQDGVYRFKSRWNTQDLPYLYHVKVNDARVYKASRAFLLAEYPNFFVIPFRMLKA